MSLNYKIENCDQVTESSLYETFSSNPTFFYLDSKQTTGESDSWSFMGVDPIFSVESKNNEVCITSSFFKIGAFSLNVDTSVKEVIDKSLVDLKIKPWFLF